MLFLQEYRVLRKSALQLLHCCTTPKQPYSTTMICNDTHMIIIIIGEDRVGIGNADAGGYRWELNSNEEESP